MGKASKRVIGPKTVYPPSMTKPGQSLIPADLLKRHLAGTLPDIQFSPEYTHDSDGNQIGENLSNLELHELHDLTVRMKEEYRRRESELRDKSIKDNRQKIIDDYLKSEREKASKQHSPGSNLGEGASDQIPTPKGGRDRQDLKDAGTPPRRKAKGSSDVL